MHSLAPLIKDLAIILGVASLVTLLFQKIRQPTVLGYLIAGVIIGPYTPPYVLITDIPNIKILSDLGIIFLMFSLGLEFSFKKLKRVGFTAGITGLFEVFFMLILGYITGRLIGWSFYNSLFLAAALSISSTTIIIKALEDLRLKTQSFAEMVFGILIIEDLLAILLLVGLSTIVVTNDIFSAAIAWATIKLILVTGAWFLIGYFFVLSFFRKFMRDSTQETLTILSVALCLLLVCIADYFNYSTALGAFVMGAILAETALIHKIYQFIQPLRNIFAAVFFVSVGMLIDPRIIWDQLPLVIIICLITIIGKLFITGIGAFLSGQKISNSIRIGFSMAQIGEFSFVIAALGLTLGVINKSLYPIIVAVSAITTFSTPYLIKLANYMANNIDRGLPRKLRQPLNKYTRWINHRTDTSKSQSVYRTAIVRLVINGIIIGIIFTLTQYWGMEKLRDLIGTLELTKLAAWLIAILLCSPFIWGMLKSFYSYSRLAIFFSWFVTFIEIVLLSFIYFDTWLTGILLFILATIFFIGVYRYINKSYQWLEEQLIKNLDDSSK